jgi:acyl-CoA reductase-like NAD-dependent aldehyde dehydrogenase
MTVKTGQKCTAIRRAFVPATIAEAVAGARPGRPGSARPAHLGGVVAFLASTLV